MIETQVRQAQKGMLRRLLGDPLLLMKIGFALMFACLIELGFEFWPFGSLSGPSKFFMIGMRCFLAGATISMVGVIYALIRTSPKG
jgi:hypothetical protein